MKILITEKQQKFLNENGIQIHHDNAEQYSSSGSEDKLFYTTIEPHKIDWEGRMYDASYEHNYYSNPSAIEVDWGVRLNFAENGFSYQPFINSVKGVLVLTPEDKSQELVRIPIDSKKDWKFQIHEHYFDGYDNKIHLTDLTVNIDKKIIYFG